MLVTFFHLFVNDPSSAMMLRAAHGMAAALSRWGSTIRVQSLAPHATAFKGLTIGITGSPLAILPLARFSTELLQTDEWRGLPLLNWGWRWCRWPCVIALEAAAERS